jgi:hypothetical protein
MTTINNSFNTLSSIPTSPPERLITEDNYGWSWVIYDPATQGAYADGFEFDRKLAEQVCENAWVCALAKYRLFEEEE